MSDTLSSKPSMITTEYPDLRIARARLAIWLSDGSMMQVDGKPDKGSWHYSLDMGNMFAEPEERAAQIDRFLKYPDMKAAVDMAWTNPIMSSGVPGWRGWWWRFKQWLKEFPTS